MTILCAEDEGAFRAFATKCGCTTAQVKLAAETVGYDEQDILSFLHRRAWLSDAEYDRQTANTVVPPSPPAFVMDESETRFAAEIAAPQKAPPCDSAVSPEKFQAFLRQKLASNGALQTAYAATRGTGQDEIAMLRAMVMALVETNEILSRQLKL